MLNMQNFHLLGTLVSVPTLTIDRGPCKSGILDFKPCIMQLSCSVLFETAAKSEYGAFLKHVSKVQHNHPPEHFPLIKQETNSCFSAVLE
jgi:hypothetical protein